LKSKKGRKEKKAGNNYSKLPLMNFHSELDMETVAECLIGMIEHLTDSFLLTGIKDPASLAAEVVNLLIYAMLPKGSDIR